MNHLSALHAVNLFITESTYVFYSMFQFPDTLPMCRNEKVVETCTFQTNEAEFEFLLASVT